MPLLILNMGGEMLYILEQRLQAQSIIEEKSLRVLVDVINTMFSEKFLLEVFKPQRLYSSTSTRQIFDKLAHSSIMRLNQSSMDKLYDLMSMGCKYQLLSSNSPVDLLSITLNHLDALRKLINNNNAETSKLIELASSQSIELFRQLKFSQLFILRYSLARFFQDRRVKVSLFLQDQIQQSDGNIIISTKGKLAKGYEVPGTIRYFNPDNSLAREETINLPNAQGLINSNSPNEHYNAANNNHYVNELLKGPRLCELGTNLYAKDRRKAKNSIINSKDNNNTGNNNNNHNNIHKSKQKASDQFNDLSDESSKKVAKAELNLLAQMIGQVDQEKNKEKFTVINLFPDTSMPNNSAASEEKNSSDFITFDAEDNQSEMAKRIANLGFEEHKNNSAAAGGEEDGEDLLQLMDSAS
jgi:hypothetical protein